MPKPVAAECDPVFSRRCLASLGNYKKIVKELISGNIWVPNTPKKAQEHCPRDTK